MSRKIVNLPTPRDGHWLPGEHAVFTYSLAEDSTSEISARLFHRTGSFVTIIGRDADGVDDNDPELATLAQRGEAGSLRTYRVQFDDGHVDDAFEDELSEVQS
jgi:hypothetical protein